MYQIIHEIKTEVCKQMQEVAGILNKKIYKTKSKFKININKNNAKEILSFEANEYIVKKVLF